MKIPILAVILFSSSLARSAPFQNLDFEMARTNSLTLSPLSTVDYEGPTADLLPGWQLFFGTQPRVTLGFNLGADPFAEQRVSLVSSDAPFGSPGEPLKGKYGLFFWPGHDPQFSLTQTGEIPADAKSLEFTYRQLPFTFSINGLTLSPVRFGASFGERVAMDVSQFAGQTVELKITTSAGPFGPSGFHELDDIAFVVPEPSVFTLVALGSGCCLCLAIWRQRAGNRMREARSNSRFAKRG
jgi:hypothetical protein